MIHLIILIVLATLALLGVSLQKTYGALPVKELKRRAQHGDGSAQALYQAASYGVSLRALLWIIIVVASSGLLLLIAGTAPWWLAMIIIVGYLWLAFAWLPRTQAGSLSYKLTVWLAPLIAKALNLLHPLLDWLGVFVARHSKVQNHTTLYQKDDLLELLDQQLGVP